MTADRVSVSGEPPDDIESGRRAALGVDHGPQPTEGSRPPVSGEPRWECGATDGERPGYVCGRPAGHKGMHRRRTEASTGAALDGERLYRTYWRTQWDHPGIVGYKPARQWEQLQPEEQAIWNATAARLTEQEGEGS